MQFVVMTRDGASRSGLTRCKYPGPWDDPESPASFVARDFPMLRPFLRFASTRRAGMSGHAFSLPAEKNASMSRRYQSTRSNADGFDPYCKGSTGHALPKFVFTPQELLWIRTPGDVDHAYASTSSKANRHS